MAPIEVHSNPFSGEHKSGNDDEADVLSDGKSCCSAENSSICSPRSNPDNELSSTSNSRAMKCLRLFVLLLFVVISVLVPLGVFVAARRSEVHGFETQVQGIAHNIFDFLSFDVARTLVALDTLDVAATTLAIATNATWPTITFPDFELLAGNALTIANTHDILFAPYVTNITRQKWESYSMLVANDWLSNSAAGMNENARRRSLQSAQIHDTIFRLFQGKLVAQPGKGPYFPIWQHTPINPKIVNFDLYSHQSSSLPRKAIQVMMETEMAVIDEIQLVDSTSYYFGMVDVELGDPVSMMYYPIFDSFKSTKRLVGLFATTLVWKKLFAGILKNQEDGIVCVIENACGQTFTFEVNGQNAEYLGAADFHDHKYDHVEESYMFDALQTSNVFDFRNGSTPLNQDYCPYSIRVYPSNKVYKEHVTFKPGLYAGCVALVFLIILLVIFTYDIVLQRRMENVSKAAQEYRKVVSSLFPAVVRDRLFRFKPEKKKKDSSELGDHSEKHLGHPSGKSSRPQTHLQTFKEEGSLAGEEQEEYFSDGDDSSVESKPIADLFPDCTVLFADIAGFTYWSSEREPVQVFNLLQALFNAFDREARKRKGKSRAMKSSKNQSKPANIVETNSVFKVETIGDCYLAVTGLPGMKQWPISKTF